MVAVYLLVVAVATVFLLLGSYFDLKTSEVPEKVSMGLIGFMMIVSVFHAFLDRNVMVAALPLILGLAFLAFGYVLFISGQWGGGDVKIVTGIGFVLGYLRALDYPATASGIFPYYLAYPMNMALISMPYVLAYSLFLIARKPDVLRDFSGFFRDKVFLIALTLSALPYLLTSVTQFPIQPLRTVSFFIPVLVVLSAYMKSVERIALRKTIKVGELREADIVAEDIVIDGRKIASKRDIEGLIPEQIKELRQLAKDGRIPKTLTIKWGIRFVPILAISFLATFLYGNLLELMLFYLIG